MDSFISVKNFEKYQNYKHRNPPWIKFYREFWTDHRLLQLAPLERFLFLGCCSLAGELGNKIPADPKYLSHRLGFSVSEAMIQKLLSSTLLYSTLLYSEQALCMQDASNLLASCKQVASTDEKPLEDKRNYNEEAKQVLAFLNEKAGKSFRETDTNLKFIIGRLRGDRKTPGVDVQTCKSLIANRVRRWGRDPDMMDYLRPETLFNATKFESYLAEVTP